MEQRKEEWNSGTEKRRVEQRKEEWNREKESGTEKRRVEQRKGEWNREKKSGYCNEMDCVTEIFLAFMFRGLGSH